MTAAHHPYDQTLAAFAAGALDEGRSLVVATHLATCPACRRAVQLFERARGVALADAEPAAMAASALQNALRVIASETPAPAVTAPRRQSEYSGPLAAYPLGAWRRIGVGLQWRSVGVPGEAGTRVFMLKAAPGTRIPAHTHSGIEWTSVLHGAFRHQLGRYGAGDFDEADETVEHHPVVEDQGECICLVALQGEVKLKGLVGRLIQPFVRI
jgi:putative transcriptional regulator